MPDQDPGERQARPPATGGAGRGRRWLATLLVLVVVGGIGYFLLQQPPPPSGGEGPEPAATAPAGADGNPADATSMKPHGTTARRIRAAQDPDDLAAHAIPGEPAPTMGEVIEGLHRAGIRSGLGAFNPPGTSPPLVGPAVQEFIDWVQTLSCGLDLMTQAHYQVPTVTRYTEVDLHTDF